VERFRAFVAERRGDQVDRGIRELEPGELPEGDVLVRVEYSSVNYKDALATIGGRGVARTSPLVPGIDLAGEVVEGEAGGASRGTGAWLTATSWVCHATEALPSTPASRGTGWCRCLTP